MNQYNIIIVGTGAGRATLAYELPKKSVLIIYRGDFLPKKKKNWDLEKIASDLYGPNNPWLNKDNNEFLPFTHYCVGGNTKMYGAINPSLTIIANALRVGKHMSKKIINI